MIISTNNDEASNRRTPAVTVVIPAYDAARYIGEALDSVKAQTVSDYEVIVVNDGSNDRDELERVLHSHPLSIIYLSQENRGVSAARNAAIEIGKGAFYAQLDADDQWTPDYLEVQLRILSDNPNVAVVYPNATIIGDGSHAGLEFMKISPSEGDVNFETLVRQKCVVMTSVTARMNVIREAGMFDESLRSCEDFDLWLRIVKNGGRIIYHRRPLVRYRRHRSSLSSDRIWMTRNLLAVFGKSARTLNLTDAEFRILNDQINSNRATLYLFEGKRALSAGEVSAALVHFKKANQHLRRPKLAMVIFFLRHLPRLVTWTFATRERLLISQPAHQLAGFDHPRATAAAKSISATDDISHKSQSCDST
jgi:glycosyltransferase involved in cell wall biosynthesis